MEIFDLNNLPSGCLDECGGKAKGLAQLSIAGLRVAPGFVILSPQTEADYLQAAKHYLDSGYRKVAVRSSATAEDGADFSNAGQYTTYLNVEGEAALIEAVRNCVASLKSNTAEHYSQFFGGAKSASMSVVVQEMVDASVAGVCFTKNPVTGEHELIIEAVEGLGEALVSGMKEADRYIVSYREEKYGIIYGNAVKENRAGQKDVLSGRLLEKIQEDVQRALAHFRTDLDLEWAVGEDGQLTWLQARPITTLDEATIDELDGKFGDGQTVFTTCNIGEMLPGAVTPLSLSTSVAGIDYGLRQMLIRAGAYRNLKQIPKGSCVTSYSNHLFFNLTSIYRMATTILGAQKEHVEVSICGKNVDTPPLPWKTKNGLVRIRNGIRYLRFVMSRKKAMKQIDKLVMRMRIQPSDQLGEYYDNIDQNLGKLNEATLLHYKTSAHSGAMSSALLQIVQSGYPDIDEAKGIIAALLENIDDIESVDILRSMRRIAAAALKKDASAVDFSSQLLLRFIKEDTGELKQAYEYFLKRHGHRAIREAELRSVPWKNDEPALMENILTVMKTGAEEPKKADSQLEETIAKVTEGKKGILKKVIKYMIKQARSGVYNREYTKSKFVIAVDVFKEAYQDLATRMVKAGALPETDLIYFLTHEEIGQLIKEKKAVLIKRAVQRRRLLEEQKELKFKELYIGFPKAIEQEHSEAENGSVLSGAPISRGEVKGIARIVKNVEDAKSLKEGEIMIASFTDIGWSPYYSVIGGLVTEVGSALSHGAVVAREYALPLVVNVANATNIIRTGDYVHLNGSRGTVTILERIAS